VALLDAHCANVAHDGVRDLKTGNHQRGVVDSQCVPCATSRGEEIHRMSGDVGY